MLNKNIKKNSNDSDYISELKEWQDHQYTPGYHLGSGKMVTTLNIYKRYPFLLILSGVFGLVIGIVGLFSSKFNFSSIFPMVLVCAFSGLIIYGGICRTKELKKN